MTTRSDIQAIGYCDGCSRVYLMRAAIQKCLAQDCAFQRHGYRFITAIKDSDHLVAIYILGGWDALVEALKYKGAEALTPQ